MFDWIDWCQFHDKLAIWLLVDCQTEKTLLKSDLTVNKQAVSKHFKTEISSIQSNNMISRWLGFSSVLTRQEVDIVES